jgi:hypothetical protein
LKLPIYFGLVSVPDEEAKRALMQIASKKRGKSGQVVGSETKQEKKQRKKSTKA